MAEYRISGVWKDTKGVITHYAVHVRTKNKNDDNYSIAHAMKKTKAETIALLANANNTAKTYLWNYSSASWYAGGDVHVVNTNPPYLRTNHDNQVKDNLSHLINYGYIY